MRWDRLSNGVLLAAADNKAFHLLGTADKGIYSQQNHRSRMISLIILGNNKLIHLDPQQTEILAAIGRVTPGSYECQFRCHLNCEPMPHPSNLPA